MRIKEILLEYHFLGTCVNSFDEDGNCVVPGLYNDVSDFAVHEENAQQITKSQFLKHIGRIDHGIDKEISHNRIYLHDSDNGVFMIYDVETDIHYFFRP